MAKSDQFYIELRDEVDGLLEELGTSFEVRGIDSFDDQSLTVSKTEQRTVDGVVADQSLSFGFLANTSFLDNASPEWLSTKNLILTAASNPLENEEILVDGKWFPLSKINPIKPADITVVFILDVSK